MQAMQADGFERARVSGLLLVPLGEVRSEPTTWRTPMSTEIPRANMDQWMKTMNSSATESEFGHLIPSTNYWPDLAGFDISFFVL